MKEQSSMKKEFSSKDVNRMRNIITGKTGDKTQILSGYEKSNKDYKEGDIWKEDGKNWTIKNGIKQTITKLDRIKSLSILPLCCPNCNKPMKINDINKKMYNIHSICFDCVLKKEDEIKRSGNWESYEKNQLKLNRDASLYEFEQALESWVNQKDTFVTEAGDIENWSNGDKLKMYSEIKKQIQKVKNTDIY
jgi:hypothetical protein